MTTTLPALTGTERQIASATLVRDRATRTLPIVRETIIAAKPGAVQVVDEFIAAAFANPSAGWWLDNSGLQSERGYSQAPAFRQLIPRIRAL